MNNKEKIQILNERINNYKLTIKLIEQGIIDDPIEKLEGITRRESINNLLLIISSLTEERNNLMNMI
jgi:hypothetical protein